MELKDTIVPSSHNAAVRLLRHCVTCTLLKLVMRCSSLSCDLGKRKMNFCLILSLESIPDTRMCLGDATSDNGGSVGQAPEVGGKVVARPAMAPCKSERVNPLPDEDLVAGAPGVAADAEVGAGVVVSAAVGA